MVKNEPVFQYTDELTPFLEWLEESIAKSTREIQSNSVAETEEILVRHEKNLDQLDKKKKVYTDQKTKGEKLSNDPKAPKFLGGQLGRLQVRILQNRFCSFDFLFVFKKFFSSFHFSYSCFLYYREMLFIY